MEITISPLSLEQVDQLAHSQENPTADPAELRVRRYQLVLWGLNNAEPQNPWTEQRLRKEFDLVLLSKLTDEVLAFSGLESKKEGLPAPGESPAASAIS